MRQTKVDSLELERRRDSQQWALDWVIKQTGRVQNFEVDERDVPPEVKSYAMVPRAMQKLGAHAEAIALAAELKGHRETARQLYYKAIGSYAPGQHAIFYDDHPDKIFLYERINLCYDRLIELASYPIERVEIPWEGVSIPGIFHRVPGARKAPTVLFLPGMDMIKEMFPDPSQNPFVERGMNILVIDGPGQGESNLRKIRVTADNYERAASAAITYLLGRPEVDPDRIALSGFSMGSYWSYRTAALDPRIKAVGTGAACYGGKKNIFEMSSPRFKQIFMYMAGIHDEAEFDRMATRMHLDGYMSKIQCPCLLTMGEYDPLTPLDDAVAAFDQLAGPKELWVLENEFHGQSRAVPGLDGLGGLNVFPFIADWLRDTLAHGAPADLDRRILIPKSSGIGPYSAEVEDFGLRSRHPNTGL